MRQKAHSKVNADLRSPISLAIAERDLKIKQQQVSRWRKMLRDGDIPSRPSLEA